MEAPKKWLVSFIPADEFYYGIAVIIIIAIAPASRYFFLPVPAVSLLLSSCPCNVSAASKPVVRPAASRVRDRDRVAGVVQI
jgi:hypothetical protein